MTHALMSDDTFHLLLFSFGWAIGCGLFVLWLKAKGDLDD